MLHSYLIWIVIVIGRIYEIVWKRLGWTWQNIKKIQAEGRKFISYKINVWLVWVREPKRITSWERIPETTIKFLIICMCFFFICFGGFLFSWCPFLADVCSELVFQSPRLHNLENMFQLLFRLECDDLIQIQ